MPLYPQAPHLPFWAVASCRISVLISQWSSVWSVYHVSQWWYTMHFLLLSFQYSQIFLKFASHIIPVIGIAHAHVYRQLIVRWRRFIHTINYKYIYTVQTNFVIYVYPCCICIKVNYHLYVLFSAESVYCHDSICWLERPSIDGLQFDKTYMVM